MYFENLKTLHVFYVSIIDESDIFCGEVETLSKLVTCNDLASEWKHIVWKKILKSYVA